MEASFNNPFIKLAASSIALLGTVSFGIQNFIYNVDAGHRGIIFSRINGIQNHIYTEGTHFKIPILHRPIIFDVRTRPRIINSTTGTKDLQQINISLRILSHPNYNKLPHIYQTLGTNYDEKVLPSIATETIKAVVAYYNVDQLLMMRDKISNKISENLTKRAKEFNILLDDISITNLSFSVDFSKAIESKQIAGQRAERAKFVVIKSEYEKQALIINSEGESEAAKIISDAFNKSGYGLIHLRKIETAKCVAKTLSKSKNVNYIPGKGNLLMQMNKN